MLLYVVNVYVLYKLIARTSTNWHLFSVAHVCNTYADIFIRSCVEPLTGCKGHRLKSRSDFPTDLSGVPPVERIWSHYIFLQMAWHGMSAVEPEVDVPTYEGVNPGY